MAKPNKLPKIKNPLKEQKAEFVCNIDQKEIDRRRNMGLISLGIGALVSVFILGGNYEPLYSLILLPIFFIAFIGILQAEFKFCVATAFSGFDKSSGEYKKQGKKLDEVAMSQITKLVTYSGVFAGLAWVIVFAIKVMFFS